MQDPCRSCARRELHFGGCRCQAFALTGDASRTDPVCSLAPDHALVRELEQAPALTPSEPDDRAAVLPRSFRSPSSIRVPD
ncbi:hypothetical protein ABZ721_02670 [Streptomyces sp. NPDC006733]|uniref:hypothetical protein n=1 Tax=Streptomyces sp. NPDC006733 TaxID=3155460 RepID=UPI0033DCFCA1